VPNDKITHSDLAKLKREEYERRKLAKQAKATQKREDYDNQIRESEKQILDDMKGSKFNMSMNRGSVRIDGRDINIQDLDMKQLTKDSQKDITRLSQL
jgi:hypothetical protein